MLLCGVDENKLRIDVYTAGPLSGTTVRILDTETGCSASVAGRTKQEAKAAAMKELEKKIAHYRRAENPK